MYTMAKTYQDLGLATEALPLDQRALEIRRRVLGPRNPDTMDRLNAVGIDEYYLGRYDEAEKIFRRSFAAEKRSFRQRKSRNVGRDGQSFRYLRGTRTLREGRGVAARIAGDPHAHIWS